MFYPSYRQTVVFTVKIQLHKVHLLFQSILIFKLKATSYARSLAVYTKHLFSQWIAPGNFGCVLHKNFSCNLEISVCVADNDLFSKNICVNSVSRQNSDVFCLEIRHCDKIVMYSSRKALQKAIQKQPEFSLLTSS